MRTGLNPRLAYRALIGLVIAALMAVSTAPVQAVTTTIGQVGIGAICGVDFDIVQEVSNSASYTVPAGSWNVTEWSTQGGAAAGQLQMEIWRATANPGEFTLVAISAPENVAPNALNTFSLAAPVPVLPGDLLGLRVPAGAPAGQPCAANSVNPADGMRAGDGAAPAVGNSKVLAAQIFGNLLNVTATLQSADVTPPNTIIDAKPLAHTNNINFTFAFHGVDELGGSGIAFVECSIDGNLFFPCGSPLPIGLTPNTPHTFAVRAVDNAGNIDPTPATWTWLIDTIAPVLTFALQQESGGPGVWNPYAQDTWTTFKVRATWTCTDTVGGGGLIHWLPSGPTHPVNVTTFVQTWTNNGVFTQAPRGTSGADRCQDRAGNTSPGAPAASFKVKKDSSLPLCSVSGSVKLIPVGVNTTVTWALATSDSVSGVASTELFHIALVGGGLVGGDWSLGGPVADKAGTVFFSAKPQSVVFTWKVTDFAGNTKTCSATAQAK